MPRPRKQAPPSQSPPDPNRNYDPHHLALTVGDPGRYKVISPDGELLWQSNAGMQTEIFFWSNPDGPPINGKPNKNYICDEILCGGPRGPGKTAAGIAWVAHGDLIRNPEYIGLILRQSNSEMLELIEEAWKLYRLMGARRVGSPTTFEFPSGARIYTGYLKGIDSYEQYRGHHYHRIFIDEAQHIPNEELYVMIFGSSRTAQKGLRAQILLSANPDGPGNAWLKARFVEMKRDGVNAPPKTPLFDPTTRRVKIYIPGRLVDNPQMLEHDPDYVYRLMDPSHPEHRRKAWVEGDWNAVAGAFFPNFRARKFVEEPPEALHVIPAWNLPAWCHRWVSCDWGHNHHAAIYWYAIGPDRRIHVTDELIVSGAGSDELGAEIAMRSVKFLQQMQEPRLRVYLSQDAFQTRDKDHMVANQMSAGVESILGPGSSTLMSFTAEEYQLSLSSMDRALALREARLAAAEIDGQSIWFTRGNHDRIAGWSFLRTLFRWQTIRRRSEPDMNYAQMILKRRGVLAYQAYMASYDDQQDEILPMVQIHDGAHDLKTGKPVGCPILIETIPKLFCDPKRPEDVKKFDSTSREVGDDPADSLRMGVMGYHAHEHKVPLNVWLAEEVQRIAIQTGAGEDINAKIEISRQARKRYDAVNSDPADMTPLRNAMLLRRGRTNAL